MRYWLIKSEGDCYSIDHLRKDKKTPWSGVRNFQARNFMRDHMKIGDLALFYHSNSNPSGAYGIARVCSLPHEDVTARDIQDEHFDARSLKLYTQAKDTKTEFVPTWVLVDFEFVEKFKSPVSLQVMKNDPKLKSMIVCQKGSRLSIQPVTKEEFTYITKLGNQ